MTRDTFDLFQQPERGRFGQSELRQRDRGGEANSTELTLCLHRDNPLSITVSDPAKPRSKWISLPKSRIEYREIKKGVVEVSLPEWLAKREGLI